MKNDYSHASSLGLTRESRCVRRRSGHCGLPVLPRAPGTSRARLPAIPLLVGTSAHAPSCIAGTDIMIQALRPERTTTGGRYERHRTGRWPLAFGLVFSSTRQSSSSSPSAPPSVAHGATGAPSARRSSLRYSPRCTLSCSRSIYCPAGWRVDSWASTGLLTKRATCRRWRAADLYHAQRSHRLATACPYARIRHPQYAGVTVIKFGVLLKWPTLLTVVMFTILVITYTRPAHAEVRAASTEFGDEYRRYMERKPRFIPRIGAGSAATHPPT